MEFIDSHTLDESQLALNVQHARPAVANSRHMGPRSFVHAPTFEQRIQADFEQLMAASDLHDFCEGANAPSAKLEPQKTSPASSKPQQQVVYHLPPPVRFQHNETLRNKNLASNENVPSCCYNRDKATNDQIVRSIRRQIGASLLRTEGAWQDLEECRSEYWKAIANVMLRPSRDDAL